MRNKGIGFRKYGITRKRRFNRICLKNGKDHLQPQKQNKRQRESKSVNNVAETNNIIYSPTFYTNNPSIFTLH